VETAHGELAVLQNQVGGHSVVEVQVAQHVAVGVQNAGPEGGTDAGSALLALGRARRGRAQCQVRRDFTPAHTHTHTYTHGNSALISQYTYTKKGY